jgi:hypothetical protein
VTHPNVRFGWVPQAFSLPDTTTTVGCPVPSRFLCEGAGTTDVCNSDPTTRSEKASGAWWQVSREHATDYPSTQSPSKRITLLD